ncbi:MAG: (d)CMP kinase [Bacteroidetes bacterium]|nr:(d)CMP kinase [Bacteroidota bacterium]
MIIAIDGPAGSGKSSTAREVARRLEALYIDTGAMYRAVALKAIRTGVLPESPAFTTIAESILIHLEPSADGVKVFLDGEDVSGAIRSEEVSVMSSRVSQRVDVRRRMVALQRIMAQRASDSGRDVVMEGRDIGTVVFPAADRKFFVTASAEVRARRRARQLREKGEEVDEKDLLREIHERDERDSTREASPLRLAPDARVIDTSDSSFEEQVENILTQIRGNAAADAR